MFLLFSLKGVFLMQYTFLSLKHKKSLMSFETSPRQEASFINEEKKALEGLGHKNAAVVLELSTRRLSESGQKT
jgi:hypothetical protein